jgi:alpha-galactosidase
MKKKKKLHVNCKHPHPILKIPPIAHILDKWDAERRLLTYEYNGRNLLSIHVPEPAEIGYRQTSDICMQSTPDIQQLYVDADEEVKAIVTFHLSDKAMNVKPERGEPNQAILGHLGDPLLHGVTALYDILQDLLVDWHGCDWTWLDGSFGQTENGDLTARMEVQLGKKPWFVNVKPHYYRTHLGYKYHAPWDHIPKQDPVAGFCSWEAYRRAITQEDVEEGAAFFGEKLRPYGLEYFQVDDGYELMPVPQNPDENYPATFLETNEKFPAGHKGIISAIEAHGMKPGIWVHSSINNEAFAERHADDLLKTSEGKPLEGDWIGYTFDCTPPTLEKHIFPLYRGMKDEGYAYIKVDALRHVLYDGLREAVRMGLLSNEEAEQRFRALLESARKGMGEDVYMLACWGIMSEAAGLADACRIAMDSNPTWAGVRMQLFETARWFHTQRIIFLNDPDHICARTEPEWTKSLTSLVSLTGSLYMLSDPVSDYTDDIVDVIRKTLPPLEVKPGEVGIPDYRHPAYTWTKLHGFAVMSHEKPVDSEDISTEEAWSMAGESPTVEDEHPFSSLWAFHLKKADTRWCVMGRFATVPLNESSVDVTSLGLNPAERYHAFDFWQEQYMGVVDGCFPARALELGACQIVSLRKIEAHPQFLASSRHVSMGAVDLVTETWESDVLNLTFEGIPAGVFKYWVHVPADHKHVDIQVAGARVTHEKRDGKVLCFELEHTEASVSCELSFS